VASFQSLYARANDWSPAADSGRTAGNLLDRWARSEAAQVATAVDEALENFDTARAGALLAAYIDDLSNWYVRRSRRRFWDGDPAALQTLHDCLRTVTLLMAPFTPFITETVWRSLFGSTGDVASVHLAAWPVGTGELAPADPALSAQVAVVRRVVELGRAARAESSVKTRQPLGRALVSAPGWSEVPEELRRQVADELNVVALESLHDADEVITVTIKPNFRALGKRFGNRTKLVAGAITSSSAEQIAAALHADSPVTVVLDGELIELQPDELIVNQSPSVGWTVASDGAETVALDLELTPQLRRQGLLREIVRTVQEARKNAGFDVTDRISLRWLVGGSPDPAEAIREHADELAGEVLATSLENGRPDSPEGWVETHDEELGLTIWLRRA
jgi:isoleucyl-tRNA synthetase